MTSLTKKMRQVLEKADLDRAEINDVPSATMEGLAARGLIADEGRWLDSGVAGSQTTVGGRFPHYNRVKLTDKGLSTARSLQRK